MVSPKPIPRLELSGSRSGSIGARLWMPERQWRAVPALIRLMRHDKANANAGRALAASVKHAAEGKNREHCRVRISDFQLACDLNWFLQSAIDRKSTRLNSSHVRISYAVFCLKKKTHRPSR